MTGVPDLGKAEAKVANVAKMTKLFIFPMLYELPMKIWRLLYLIDSGKSLTLCKESPFE